MKHWYLAAALVSLQACGGSERRLEKEARAWQAAEVSSYSFEYSRICFCPGAGAWWRVEVIEGEVRAAALTDSAFVAKGGSLPPPDGQPTIDSLFAIARRALEAGHDSVAISYDSTYHFPREISIDRERRAIDDEWRLSVRQFTPTRQR